MPWPMASCSKMPDAPAARTHGAPPARAPPAGRGGEPLLVVEVESGATGDVVGVLLATAVLLGGAGQAEVGHRLEILDDAAFGIRQHDHAGLVAAIDVHLL